MSSKVSKIRAGLYHVAAGDRAFHVEQIRTEAPGFGVESLWWITAADGGPDLMLDPTRTKADAVADIAALVTA